MTTTNFGREMLRTMLRAASTPPEGLIACVLTDPATNADLARAALARDDLPLQTVRALYQAVLQGETAPTSRAWAASRVALAEHAAGVPASDVAAWLLGQLPLPADGEDGPWHTAACLRAIPGGHAVEAAVITLAGDDVLGALATAGGCHAALLALVELEARSAERPALRSVVREAAPAVVSWDVGPNLYRLQGEALARIQDPNVLLAAVSGLRWIPTQAHLVATRIVPDVATRAITGKKMLAKAWRVVRECASCGWSLAQARSILAAVPEDTSQFPSAAGRVLRLARSSAQDAADRRERVVALGLAETTPVRVGAALRDAAAEVTATLLAAVRNDAWDQLLAVAETINTDEPVDAVVAKLTAVTA